MFAASNLLYRQTGGRFICLPVSRSPTCRDAHDSSISLLQCTWAPFCSAYGRGCGRPPKTGAQFDVECHGVRLYVSGACYSPLLYSLALSTMKCAHGFRSTEMQYSSVLSAILVVGSFIMFEGDFSFSQMICVVFQARGRDFVYKSSSSQVVLRLILLDHAVRYS